MTMLTIAEVNRRMNITKARRAVRSDRAADAERGRARTASLPRLSSVVHKRDRAELAMTVAEAAQVLGVSHQAVDQAILRGTLPAYRHDGRRYLLVADLAETPSARRQAAEKALVDMSRAQHAVRRDHPISSESPEDRCVGTWEDCRVCGPITLVYEAEGDQLIDVPQPVKRPVSAAKLASLERARAAKILADARRRLERERDIAEMKAQIEGEGHGPAA